MSCGPRKGGTNPKTKKLPLNIGGWKMSFPFGARLIFKGFCYLVSGSLTAGLKWFSHCGAGFFLRKKMESCFVKAFFPMFIYMEMDGNTEIAFATIFSCKHVLFESPNSNNHLPSQKTNMSPEKGLFQKDMLSSSHHFSGDIR